MAVSVFGAENVMFGTDYPIFSSDFSASALATARLTEAERRLVASGTARAIFSRHANPHAFAQTA